MRTAVRAVMNGTAITLHLLTDQRNRASSWLSTQHEAGAPTQSGTHALTRGGRRNCVPNELCAHARGHGRVSVPCRICPHHLLALMSQSRMCAQSFTVLQDLLPRSPSYEPDPPSPAQRRRCSEHVDELQAKAFWAAFVVARSAWYRTDVPPAAAF